jgi:hypothetical protein
LAALEAERKYLDSHRGDLLARYGDKFLVISGDQVTGAFDTLEQALEQAAARHGLKSVLIRRPSEAQIEFSAPALLLEILSCQSSTVK